VRRCSRSRPRTCKRRTTAGYFSDLLDEHFLALPRNSGMRRDHWPAVDAPRRAPVRIGAEISSTEETVEALGAGRWAPGSTPAWWPSTVPRWCIATGSQSGPSPTCRLVTGLRMAPRRRPPAARRVALRGGRRPLRRVDQAGPARQCTAIRTLWPRRPCSTRFRCNWLRRRGRRRAACRPASLSIQELSKKIGLRGRGE
jgi:hypothetical protein